jgi:dTDP-4-amino-4,6-dideoxygalactose transaminase
MRPAEVSSEVCRRVSRYDYSHQFRDIDDLLTQIRRILLTGNYILGPEVNQFEAEFARYCDCTCCKGVNCGTDALLVAMLALGIGRGDEVIVPANTFHATVAAIELVGATPVLVDVIEQTYLMDDRELSGLLSCRTKAIIPVHLFGKPVPMASLLELAERKGLLIIEDAAQAHGASFQGRKVGSFGIAGCFSFHPSKNLAAAGDAGAIVTCDEALAARLELYRALGQKRQNEHVVVGMNSKLDTLQAQILLSKLRYLDDWNRSRAEIAGWYRSELKDLPVSFQARGADEVHVYHLLQMRTSYRDPLFGFLRARGIDAVIRYPTPIHLQPAFHKYGWKPGQFPVSESLSRELLCLPLRPAMPDEEVLYVIETTRAFFSSNIGLAERP